MPVQYTGRYTGRMTAHTDALYSAAQVRDLDRRAIADCGIAGYELMTRAGHATLDALRAQWPATRTLCVLCGPGNNGGDGYVMARVARAQGLMATVVAASDPQQLTGDARLAWQDFIAAGGRITPWSPAVLQADVIVDALLGIGLTRPVSDDIAALVQAIAAAGRPVLAVDIPTGLHADTGAVLGTAVRADLTVTFIGRKLGLYLGDAAAYVGRIVFDDLEVPGEVFESAPCSARLLGERVLHEALPPRARATHKGMNGHVLVIGGGPGMAGAARLAGEAALRAGAGLVTVAVHASSLTPLASCPELMSVAVESIADLASALQRATVIALGPGFGRSDWAHHLYTAALASGLPLIVDADALNMLAAAPTARSAWVLTPHPGEAARLLGTSTQAVQQDRLAAVTTLQQRYGGVAVLKGAGTLLQGERGTPWLCDRGNPGMATAGMGDVLTGIIAGIAAQCGDLELAARAGVLVHASAGDRAARSGERGLLASDVIAEVRACVNPPRP